MLKQRIVKIIVGLALLAAVAGSSGIAADSLGLAATSPAHACSNSSSSGGGC
ncbi:MAG: hypothetical protein H6631_09955 [Anaerolineaceae bacterium]|nr:hypothetical protein [Anaerolineaceae bacterium]MCB9098483.1 hypothetical protein [Anaerolineales bacterium]